MGNWCHVRATPDEQRSGWEYKYVHGSEDREYEILVGIHLGKLVIAVNALGSEFNGVPFYANYMEAGRAGFWRGPRRLLEDMIEAEGNLPPETASLLRQVRKLIESGDLMEIPPLG